MKSEFEIKLDHCKKICNAVYLVADESAAQDISAHVYWLITQVEQALRQRDSYAKAMAVAMRDGIFPEKSKTKSAIEEILGVKLDSEGEDDGKK